MANTAPGATVASRLKVHGWLERLRYILVEDWVDTYARAPAPTRMVKVFWSPATMPPPKLLRQAHALGPRERGVSSFIGLTAQAEVTALWPVTQSTSRRAIPWDIWPR